VAKDRTLTASFTALRLEQQLGGGMTSKYREKHDPPCRLNWHSAIAMSVGGVERI
jgi:hypothetical protein